MKVLFYLFLTSWQLVSTAQEVNFFRQIPSYPSSMDANLMIVRMIDGLGYRYYWATEGLTDENLNFRVSDESRSLGETLEHIYSLANMIESASQNQLIDRSQNSKGKTLEELRQFTLMSLEASRNAIAKTTDLTQVNLVFAPSQELPVWNLINGPIEDAVWHTGQIVMMRRAAGNPLPAGVNVLTGKTKEN